MTDGTHSRGSRQTALRRRRKTAGSTVLASTALVLALTSCGATAGQSDPDDAPAQGSSGNLGQDSTQNPGDAATGCVAPARAVVQDIDPEDSPVMPWRKPPGQELVVEFETGQLSERYARFVTEGAVIWSESPCLRAVAVRTCSSGANCVAVVEDDSPSRRTDGEMEWEDDGEYMTSATITLYTRPLGRATDNGALATVVHEMGHTLGLDHRRDRFDVMNSVTGNDTNPRPDDVNFANLLAIYGS